MKNAARLVRKPPKNKAGDPDHPDDLSRKTTNENDNKKHNMRKEWKTAKRIVIKIGSSLLVDETEGQLRQAWLTSLIKDIAALKTEGRQIILVVSGARALGRRELNLRAQTLALDEAQAAAAIGQITLSAAFKASFREKNIPAAQILLTPGDTEHRRRYLNARDTIERLLDHGAVPVVNENDTVATNELRYGDNDRLAARVASMIGADLLIILSDIDGLYTAPPGSSEGAEHISEIREITPEIEVMAGGTGSSYSSGGMVTKIMAAKIAVATGCHMVITNGQSPNPIDKFKKGGKATWFLSESDPVQARKSWIASALEMKGAITIDQGAEKALYGGNSLLPAGITHVRGGFNRGDMVSLINIKGEEVARGLSSFAADDAKKIIGKQSAEIEKILGFAGRSELIHRDNMVLTKKEPLPARKADQKGSKK